MLQSAATVSHNVNNLHLAVFWFCIFISIAAFVALIYALIIHRKPSNNKTSKHSALEIIWFIIPFIILALLIIPAAHILLATHSNNQATEIAPTKVNKNSE